MKIVGIVDDVTTCALCGRENLKKTVAVMDNDGNVNYYGCECVNKVLGRWNPLTKANMERIAYKNKELGKKALGEKWNYLFKTA